MKDELASSGPEGGSSGDAKQQSEAGLAYAVAGAARGGWGVRT